MQLSTCLRMASLFLLCAGSAAIAQIAPTNSPVSLQGVRAVVDLPKNQHIRNTGGIDGLGLCVFSSIEMTARWQNILGLAGYRSWMEARRGGGWPEKVDQTLIEYCREKGIPVPRYVQHTAGDLAFLDLAIRTGRCPCITYAGRDDFYSSAINHMVCLAHLDSERAAIIDNNRPGSWVWMTRSELRTRWLASADRFGRMISSGGGWAVVFLDPPPTPYGGPPAEAFQTSQACTCGGDPGCAVCDSCACPSVVFGQCANGRCAPLSSSKSGSGLTPPSDRHYWGQFEDGSWGWRLKDDVATPAAAAKEIPTGVVPELIASHPAYSINGHASTKEEVYLLLQHGSLADDTARWHLAVVGDPAFLARVSADVGRLPADVREKLHVQAYPPTAWQVAQFKLPTAGVLLRKPTAGRISADIGTIAAAEYSAARLGDLLGDAAGPSPKPQQPNTPDSGPASPAAPSTPWQLGAAAAALFLYLRRK